MRKKQKIERQPQRAVVQDTDAQQLGQVLRNEIDRQVKGWTDQSALRLVVIVHTCPIGDDFNLERALEELRSTGAAEAFQSFLMLRPSNWEKV